MWFRCGSDAVQMWFRYGGAGGGVPEFCFAGVILLEPLFRYI